MLVIDCEQGSDEWWQARLGIPTASEFKSILTPAKLELSTKSVAYRNKLLAEQLRGKPDESFESDWMKRGLDIETEARNYYEFLYDVEPQQVGFCLHDNKRYGCSSDGLIGNDGGLEIKCPSPGVHVGYMLGHKLPTLYKMQVLGSLLVTGCRWWDFLSYHPDLKHLIIRTYAKDVKEELEILSNALGNFCDGLDYCKYHLAQ